ncbi:hypothetical protein GCM10025778_21060 [Paeniglutamicibacter antarcticus]|uniref:Uncharacterized protein n=1 Tax=Paeniglutamicibacter antarcticus TaxID=494023 RepID=A0ABP9TNZ3_9MICC
MFSVDVTYSVAEGLSFNREYTVDVLVDFQVLAWGQAVTPSPYVSCVATLPDPPLSTPSLNI